MSKFTPTQGQLSNQIRKLYEATSSPRQLNGVLSTYIGELMKLSAHMTQVAENATKSSGTLLDDRAQILGLASFYIQKEAGLIYKISEDFVPADS